MNSIPSDYTGNTFQTVISKKRDREDNSDDERINEPNPTVQYSENDEAIVAEKLAEIHDQFGHGWVTIAIDLFFALKKEYPFHPTVIRLERDYIQRKMQENFKG